MEGGGRRWHFATRSCVLGQPAAECGCGRAVVPGGLRVAGRRGGRAVRVVSAFAAEPLLHPPLGEAVQRRRRVQRALGRADRAATADAGRQRLRGDCRERIRLGAWAALIIALALVSAGVKSYALSRREQLLDKALCDSTQKLLGKCYDDFTIAESVLRGRGTPAASIPTVSAVDVLDQLAQHAPADVKYRFDRIEITRDKLHLQGTTEAAENVDRIVSGLRNGRCFGDARSGGVRRRGTDTRFEFTIDSTLTCDGAAPADGKGA